ncbi:hypothetical protein Misp06_04103 [Microbulbifer sp. NBRC 101763]|uniref:DUF3667 domain-containing protein n=1 Tax=Microbulbifer sp. NBRC 101763 TaxID=1113820 RepID=UPI00309F7896
MSTSGVTETNSVKQIRCANCQTELLGPHCYSCGQPIKGMVRHFSSVIGDLFDTLLALDSRIWKTLPPLLFKPGFLTAEYFAGRRVRYVSPVRLFIFLCVTTFFVVRMSSDWSINFGADSSSSKEAVNIAEKKVNDALDTVEQAKLANANNPELLAELNKVQLNLTDDTEALQDEAATIESGTSEPEKLTKAEVTSGLKQAITEVDRDFLEIDGLPEGFTNWLDKEVARAQDNIARVSDDPNRFKKAFLGSLPSTLLILVPLFALMLWVIYLFKRRLYMEHLIVALHSHAFICFVLLLVTLLGDLQDWLTNYSLIDTLCNWTLVALILWIPIYLLLMQKRIYQQGWIITLMKYWALGILYPVLLIFGATLTALYTLAEL